MNDLPKEKCTTSYKAETTLVLQDLLKIKPIRIGFTVRIDPNDQKGRKDIYYALLRLITQCKPSHHVKQKEIHLKADEIRALKQEMKKQIEDSTLKVKEMKDEIAKISKALEDEKKKPPQVI